MGTSPAQKERMAIRQRLFLDAYETYGTITAAGKEADVARSEHYRWLKEDPAYAAAFREAEEAAIELLETEARRRALAGEEHPIFYRGAEISKRRVMSDPLLMFLLRAKRPEVYRDRGAVDRSAQASPDADAQTHLLTRLSRETLEHALADLTDAGTDAPDAPPGSDPSGTPSA